MTKRVMLAVAAVLGPSIALAQTDDLPRTETAKPETSLAGGGGPAVPQAMKENLEALRKQLETAPKAPDPQGKPKEGDKGAQKGGAVDSSQDLMWEDEVEQFEYGRRKKPAKKLEGGVSDVHVVQPGDTLWDLSSKFLNSPWLWPRVWSYNPHITNPHWIYPGQVVRFRPAVAAAPDAPEPPPPERRPEVVIPGHAGITGFRHASLVTKEQVKAAGKLENSPNDSMLLTKYQTAYVAFEKPQSVKVGDKFLSARVEKRLEHPVTKKEVAYFVLMTGELEVTAVAQEGKFFTVAIRKGWRSIERSNIILPYEDLHVKIERKPNTKDLRGYVIGSVEEEQLGRYHVVFLDLGEKDGLEKGNLLRVVRRGDGYLREEEYEDNLKKMPLEELGEVFVLSPKKDFSVGLLLRNNVEVNAGDKVELRKGE